MKQLLIAFMSLFLSIPSGKSQNMCGVYKTANDLKYQQFNITADRQTKGHAIEVSNFFLRPYIYIHTGGKKIKIPMDSIYALKQYDEKIYRIWQRKCYQLIDSSFLLIFSYKNRITKMIPTSRSARPVTVTQREYYFCCDYSEPLIPLTPDNILLALHADKPLSKAIHQRFRNQQELIETKQAQQTSINLFLKNYKQQER
ncbi:MAG: hypothetical protein H6Q17_2303 [Bacteroidetes bacterium]|jgi:hypothetical protein|nr:hypothetical protein [Bacteroidota bacterium]